MNNARVRHRSNRRNATPSAMCLPSPKPPETVPRHDGEAARALPLHPASEPLVTGGTASSRQNRRQQQRQQAKALRREQQGHVAEAVAAAEAKVVDLPIYESLPRDRSLALVKTSRLRAVGQWLRSLVMVSKPRSSDLVSRDKTVAQVRAMRSEIATMQRTLDRMLRSMAG